MDINNLQKFLVAANKNGYAAGESVVSTESDGSYSIRYQEGEYACHDNWFGGEPFGGRQIVFYKNKPLWMVVYYGSDSQKTTDLIPFLRKALANMPEDFPVRGAKEFSEGKYKYVNEWKGNLSSFTGEEKIYYEGKEVYSATYSGGLVDQR